MLSDQFSKLSDSPTAPARRAQAIVPHDAIALDPVPKAIAIGGAGDIVLRAMDSTADVTIAVQAGQLLPIRARFVRATGTTATGLVSLA